MSEFQLRIYHLKEKKMDEFIEGWRTYVVPLRERFGFKIVAALCNKDEDEFVWIIGYDGTDGFKAANARYYNSPERKRIPWSSSPYLDHVDLKLLRSVPVYENMG